MRIRPYSRALAETIAASLDLAVEVRRLVALCDEHRVRYDPDVLAAEAHARIIAGRGADTPFSALFLLLLHEPSSRSVRRHARPLAADG